MTIQNTLEVLRKALPYYVQVLNLEKLQVARRKEVARRLSEYAGGKIEEWLRFFEAALAKDGFVHGWSDARVGAMIMNLIQFQESRRTICLAELREEIKSLAGHWAVSEEEALELARNIFTGIVEHELAKH